MRFGRDRRVTGDRHDVGMLRIHFTPADLGRVQITGPDVMAELVTTARNLVNGHPGTAVARGVSSTARPLLQLLERPDACPDFLTPGGELGVRSAFHAVLATPAGRVREELADYSHHAWTRDPGTVRQRLAPALHAYYDLAFRSQWPALSSRASRDQVTRMRMVAAGGLDDLFAHLHSMISWRSSTLSAVCEYDLDMYLDGRGLRLVPIASLTRPSVIDRPGAPLEIHYPAQAPAGPVRRVDALGPLLGRTPSQHPRLGRSGRDNEPARHPSRYIPTLRQ